MLGEDILYMPVRELGMRIRSKQISPVELTESYLARSERFGPKLNAYAAMTRELALQQARAAEKDIAAGKYRGPLHGIPYAAKDLLAVKGYPTTWGAKPYANQMFDYTALAAFAIGTETWGSIICPSAYCGISGLRPTFGRVSRYGAMALAYSLDKIGPMGRTADDCALILSAIAGHDPLDRSSLPPAEASFSFSAAESTPLKIGVLTNAWDKPDPEIKAAVDTAIAVLKQHGASTSDAKLPEGPYEAAAGLIVGVEGAAAFRSLIESGKVAELVDPLGQIGGYINEQLSADDYMRALQIRGIFQKRADALFDEFDVLVAASLPIAATTLETNLETDLTFSDPLGGIGNLCGLPAISVPCGFTSKTLPIGIQFIGRVRNDRAVVAAASLFQRNTDWHTRRPPIA